MKEGLKIAFLPKQINNPYFDDLRQGRRGRGRRRSRASSSASARPTRPRSRQVSLHQHAHDAEAGRDRALSANDVERGRPALGQGQGRRHQGRHLRNSSTGAPEGRDLFINQAAAEDLGRSQVQLLAKQIGPEGGEIAILSATPNATNQNTGIEFMEDEPPSPSTPS